MDIVIIVGVIGFLLLMTYSGYKRGFVKIVLSMFALIGAIIMASILVVPVGAAIKNTTKIYDTVKEEVSEVVKSENIQKITDIDKLNVPDTIKEAVKKETAEGAENVAEKITETVANSIFNAGVFVVTFIICYIIIAIVINAINLVTKLPVLNEVNKLAGTALGLMYGLGILWVICLVLPMFGNMDWAKNTIKVINENKVLTFIYDHNLLITLITKISK